MSSDVESLVEMGFPRNRAEKALFKTQYKGVQQAMDWLFAHGEDPDIDDPFEAPKGQTLGSSSDSPKPEGESTEQEPASEATSDAGASTSGPEVARSLKCDDCGKLLKSAEHAELHAARSGHANFSESTEEIKPLTEEEKKQQMEKLQEKIKQKRAEKAEQEKQEQILREKMRRTTGKEMTSIKQKMEEDEIKKLVEQRKREKEEERKARQRVKEQIEKDKIDRAAKFAKTSSQSAPQSSSSSSAATAPAATATTAPQEKKEYNQARIQIRLTNGQALTQSFGAKEPLSAVRLFTQMKRTDGEGPIAFMTTFPRKVYTDSDMDAPLDSLGLVPSAVLIVTKPQ